MEMKEKGGGGVQGIGKKNTVNIFNFHILN